MEKVLFAPHYNFFSCKNNKNNNNNIFATSIIAVPDYCYILNLNTKQWVQKNIDAPAGTALIRTKHSGT